MDFEKLPKIELHRHLEGSLRLSTLIDIKQQFDLPDIDLDHLSKLVQVQIDDPHSVSNFLSKFAVLRNFYQSPEVIQRIAREVIEDAAKDNIRYIELRFTPVALSRVHNYPLDEVMDWVTQACNEASKEFNLGFSLIASVNRNEPVELAEKVIHLAIDRQEQGIIGIDLAGDEVNFPADSFRSLFLDAKKAGMHICVHAGEWAGSENIIYAIEFMQADRIGHGVRIIEDPHAIVIARERQTPFEVCITSNYQSGVISSIAEHPIKKMLEQKLLVTINTDDPEISQITLSDEYKRAHQLVGLSKQQIYQSIITAAHVSFLNHENKNRLISGLEFELIE